VRNTDNPFSVFYLYPEHHAFAWPGGDIDDAFPRLTRGGQFEITGPHGTGKSTMLHHLYEAAGRRGIPRTWWKVDPERRGFRAILRGLASAYGGIFFLDSAEALPQFLRRYFLWRAARKKVTVVLTAHGPLGLTALERPAPSLELFTHIVRNLLTQHPRNFVDIPQVTIEEIYERYAPDLRKMLFSMYDHVEETRAAAVTS